MTDNDGASAGMSGAHFVPLSTITGLYKGSLEAYMRDTGCRDVVITMQVTMEVAGSRRKPNFLMTFYDGGYTDKRRRYRSGFWFWTS